MKFSKQSFNSNLFKVLPRILLILCALISVSAQSGIPPIPSADDKENKDQNPFGRDMLPYELTRAAEKLLDISSVEKDRFKRERQGLGYRLLKIFSAPKCAEGRLVIDVSSPECRDGADLVRASFYSVRRGLYGETLADIRVLENRLIAGNGSFVHGFLIDLGNSDLGSFSIEEPRVKSLFDYPVATTLDAEGAQRKLLASGFVIGEEKVASEAQLEKDHVYLLRLVSYSFKKGDWSFFNRDQMFVFKFIELDNRKAGLFLLKKLGERPAPKL